MFSKWGVITVRATPCLQGPAMICLILIAGQMESQKETHHREDVLVLLDHTLHQHGLVAVILQELLHLLR